MAEQGPAPATDESFKASMRFTATGQLIHAEGPIYRILGWPAAELYGHRLPELVHRADHTQLERFLQHPAEGAHSNALRIMHQVDGWRWCQLTWLRSHNEISIRNTAVTYDLQSRRKSDRSRRPSGPRPLDPLLRALRPITDRSKFILLVGDEGRIRYISPNFLEATDRRPEDIDDISFEQLWRALRIEYTSPGGAERFLAGVFNDKQARLEAATFSPLKGEPVSLSLEAHRLPWDDAELVLIVGTPLTHRNDAIAARSMSDLQKESLGALVHELRNVLNIFTGHTGLLLGTSLTAEQETSVAQLVKYAEHTVALNESLALLPHFYEDAFETLDLAGALRQSAPLLKLLWRDTESLTIDLISDDLQANINKGKLVAELLEMTRALRRQASSAARLSITLAREDSEQSTDFLEVQSHRFLAAISLELTADSETMSQSTALASVDQLQTNASNRLEASTAHLRDFLTSCGGALTTTLTDESLRMDLRVPDLSRSDSDDDDKTKTRTVLLIEDDTGVRDLVVIFLESIGMDVVTIQSEDDLKALPMTNYALIVSDVMLPGARSGPELVAMVRRRQPNLPCLFISGYKQGVLKDEDLESDLTDFLPKPFSKSAFLNKVRTFLPAENSAS